MRFCFKKKAKKPNVKFESQTPFKKAKFLRFALRKANMATMSEIDDDSEKQHKVKVLTDVKLVQGCLS